MGKKQEHEDYQKKANMAQSGTGQALMAFFNSMPGIEH
jgi:hypothetical protein